MSRSPTSGGGLLADDGGGPDPVVGPERVVVPIDETGAAELPGVDGCVVAVGQVVPVESVFDVGVADDPGSWVATLARVVEEGLRSTDMVEVAVGVDDRVDRVVRPGAQRGQAGRCHQRRRGVDQAQHPCRPEDDHVRERLDDGDVVADLGELAGEPVGRRLGVAVGDQSLGQCQQIGHEPVPRMVVGRHRAAALAMLPVARTVDRRRGSCHHGVVAGRATSMVWYVSYGSNLDPNRLGTYLAGGTPEGGHYTYRGARDASPPQAQRPCRVPHHLYFAGESRTWGGGVAFLDHEHVAPAPTLGHAYLVTAGQFEDVAAQETGRAHAEVEVAEVRASGSVTLGTGRYDRVVWLGDEDGIPQLTFTSPEPSSAAEPAAPRTALPPPHPGGTGGGARHDGGGECRLPETLVRRGRALVGGGPDQSGLGRTGIVPMEPRLAPLTREDSS